MMDDDIDLSDWPDALDAYELARRDVADSLFRDQGDPDPARELATMKRRAKNRGLGPEAEARLMQAIAWSEADGRAGDGPRWVGLREGRLH